MEGAPEAPLGTGTHNSGTLGSELLIATADDKEEWPGSDAGGGTGGLALDWRRRTALRRQTHENHRKSWRQSLQATPCRSRPLGVPTSIPLDQMSTG